MASAELIYDSYYLLVKLGPKMNKIDHSVSII